MSVVTVVVILVLHVSLFIHFSYLALEIVPNDPKCLYRRCLAYEKLGKLEEAYKDAGMLMKVDPKNVAIKPVLARLTPVIREKVCHHRSIRILSFNSRTCACEPFLFVSFFNKVELKSKSRLALRNKTR